MTRSLGYLAIVAACAASQRPFPLRDPLVVDDDMRSVSGPPRKYVSPFIWDQLDNLLFARLSRTLEFAHAGEARNANSLDEVADSSWFTNRETVAVHDDGAPGACTPDDKLPGPDQVEPGGWVIDHGKDNGSTPGFRVAVPGKGKYLLKADDEGKPDRASAASVIGAAFYDAIGFHTSCEQIVVIRRAQLKLMPNLQVIDNAGVARPFDEAALDKVLETSTQVAGGGVRMQASKWLPGVTVGPFRYLGTRDDDPNDVVDHADRRELRGSRLLAAWIDHWDAREQNSMDVWLADDPEHEHSSPGHVVHYLLDTSDALGGEIGIDDMSKRLGHAYEVDFPAMGEALVTFGADERAWDRAHREPGMEKFGYYTARDFEPSQWRPFYPNPAFLRMTERDGAWMARKIAMFSPEDVRRFAELGQWSGPNDVAYVTKVLLARQRMILRRYLGKLSPLGNLRVAAPNRICATDFARLRELYPASAFRYSVFARGEGLARQLTAIQGDAGAVCFDVPLASHGDAPADDPRRRIEVTVRNGTRSGPLIVYLYDLEGRGMKMVGAARPR